MISWTRDAATDIERLDRRTRERVRRALYRLDETGHGDVKRLRGYEDEYRLRVGRLRVRFTFEPSGRDILVLRVLPRGRAYRR